MNTYAQHCVRYYECQDGQREPKIKRKMENTTIKGVMWWLSTALKVKVKSRLTLCDPMDCSPPGSSVHGIIQARVLEWVAIAFSRGSSQPRDWTRVSCIADRRFTIWATRKQTIGYRGGKKLQCWSPVKVKENSTEMMTLALRDK